MDNQNETKNIGKWEAWTKASDFVTHLYVQGSVPTNREKPILELTEAEPQGTKPNHLLLELNPDVVNPNGSETLNVELYKKEMEGLAMYDSVMVRTSSSYLATIKIEQRP